MPYHSVRQEAGANGDGGTTEAGQVGPEASPVDGPSAVDQSPTGDLLPPPPDTLLSVEVPPPPPDDEDSDGILNADDPCPQTPNPLLLEDTFGDGGDWKTYSGSWSVDQGDYVQQQLSTTNNAQHLYHGSFSGTDIYVEVSATSVQVATTSSCKFLGVAARSQLPGSFVYQACGFNVTSCSNPEGLIGLDHASPLGSTVHPKAMPSLGNGPYNLRFKVIGNSFSCWLAGDPSQAASWTAAVPAGSVELMTQCMSARFHEIRVYGIPTVCN